MHETGKLNITKGEMFCTIESTRVTGFTCVLAACFRPALCVATLSQQTFLLPTTRPTHAHEKNTNIQKQYEI